MLETKLSEKLLEEPKTYQPVTAPTYNYVLDNNLPNAYPAIKVEAPTPVPMIVQQTPQQMSLDSLSKQDLIKLLLLSLIHI